jgi:hypothetical protein
MHRVLWTGLVWLRIGTRAQWNVKLLDSWATSSFSRRDRLWGRQGRGRKAWDVALLWGRDVGSQWWRPRRWGRWPSGSTLLGALLRRRWALTRGSGPYCWKMAYLKGGVALSLLHPSPSHPYRPAHSKFPTIRSHNSWWSPLMMKLRPDKFRSLHESPNRLTSEVTMVKTFLWLTKRYSLKNV